MKPVLPFVLLIFIIPLIVSCNPKSHGVKAGDLPSDSIIPEKKMVSLLTDVHVLEAGLMIRKNKGQQDRKWADDAYASLFRRYRITNRQMIRNLEYYQKDPVTFGRIYDTVIKHLNSLKEKTNRIKKQG